MATPVRPKQRVLVRWNDDLDKSLLLYITHTCTEMGIKIPYDEVARRMGSTFTEGAIQQHIAKLRTKMAELNVVPVPAPPRRGTVTTRPSGVYSQKPRMAPPSVPATATSRQRSTTIGASIMGDQQTEEQPAPARKGRAKRRKTVIKRSESDVGESDEELEAGDDEEYVAHESNKRKRSGQAQTGRSRGSRVSTQNDEFQSKTVEMMQRLQQADEEYDAAQDADANHDNIEPMENSGGPASRTRGIQFDYTQFNTTNINRQGEEEEEEIELNHPDAEFRSQGNRNAHYAQYSQDDHVSPTSQTLTIPQQQQVTTPPEQIFQHLQPHNSPTDYQFVQPSTHAMPPPPLSYSSNTQSNVDFSNWPGFSSNGFSNNSSSLLQSPYPNTGPALNSSQEPKIFSRNPSTISNNSTQDLNNGTQALQTPGFDNSGTILPSLLHPTTPTAGSSYYDSLYSTPDTHDLAADLFMPQPIAPEEPFDFGYNPEHQSFFEDAFNFSESN